MHQNVEDTETREEDQCCKDKDCIEEEKHLVLWYITMTNSRSHCLYGKGVIDVDK